MSISVWPRCTWEGCGNLAADELRMILCWSHSRAIAEDYIAAADAWNGKIKEQRAGRGLVYYLRIGDLIKIGYTTNLYLRMEKYPPNAELLATEYGDRKLERERHSRFSIHLRRGREWFDPAPELMKWIEGVGNVGGDDSYPYEFTSPKRKEVVGGKRWTGRR